MDELLAGRYRLGPVLGRGGMGTVHRAHDRLLDRAVAVKLLAVAHAPQAALERFRREARFLAGLAHPNVVTVFDFGIDDSQAWLVMELLAGPTLQDLVNERGPLPIPDVVRYGRECAAALAAAHAAGITHRDVKPANLMLAADRTCKLLDLGIARLDGAATTQPALTQAGQVLGTVPYLAPEVITGGAPEPPADVYALGGVLFALLTARPPFQGEDLMAAMAQHVHAPSPRPSALRPDVPPELDGLVLALLGKDPAQRPTAADVVARLDGSPRAAGAPTVAMPHATPGAAATSTTQLIEPPDRPRRRTGLIAAAVVLALAVVAAVTAIAAAGNDTAGNSANPPATPKRSSPAATHAATHASTGASPAHPSSATRSSPPPTTLSAALAALRSAVTAAQASGGLDAKDAQDLLHRVDAMAAVVSGPAPGGPGPGPPDPGHGHGDGKGKGKGKNDQGGGAPDLSGPLDDFAHHLDDLHNGGQLSGSAYAAIGTALDRVRSFTGSGSD